MQKHPDAELDRHKFVEGSQVEKDLYNSLLHGYSRNVRPVKNAKDSIDVTVKFSLVEVLDVKEDEGHLHIKVWMGLSWKDEYFQWNPDQHGGIKRLNFPTEGSGRIWLPDILVLNAMQSEPDRNIQAVVRSDGTVRWVQPAVYMIRVRHEFRGNSWVASFDVGSWTYDETMLDIHPPPPVTSQRTVVSAQEDSYVEEEELEQPATSVVDMDTESFVTNDQWGVLEHSGRRESRAAHDCCSHERYVTLHYVLKLRKKLGPSLLG